MDETTTGLARTGRVWAHEHAGLAPDVIVGVEGLGAALSIGFAATREPVTLEEPRPPSTLACAAGCALVKVVRCETLWKVAEANGHELAARPTANGIEAVGAGLHVAVRVPPRLRADVRELLMEASLIAPQAQKGWLPLQLPRIMSDVEMRETVDGVARVLAPGK